MQIGDSATNVPLVRKYRMIGTMLGSRGRAGFADDNTREIRNRGRNAGADVEAIPAWLPCQWSRGEGEETIDKAGDFRKTASLGTVAIYAQRFSGQGLPH